MNTVEGSTKMDKILHLIQGMMSSGTRHVCASVLYDIVEAADKIVDYNWKDEMRNFQETFEVVIQSQDDIHEWILWCQDQEITGNNQPINHIFYSLMQLKSKLL